LDLYLKFFKKVRLYSRLSLMESEPFELTEQYHPIEFSHQDYGYPQDDYQYTHSNSKAQHRTNDSIEHSGALRQSEDTKLFRNIVRRYGPGELKEVTGQRLGGSTIPRSPNKTLAQKQSQENLQPKFSFHPEINEMPKDIYREAGKKIEISKEEQWERLLKPKNDVIQQREQKKIEKETQEIQENCTFQPTINREYEISSSKYANAKSLTVTDRLYSDGMEKQKIKEMGKHIRSDDSAECTFQPDVAKSVSYLKGEKISQRPLHERLGDIMKQKQEFLQRLRMEAETTNKDMVFQPSINEHTQILADAKQQVRDVTERLMKDAADKVYKKMKQAEQYETQLTSTCTFKPNVHPISRSNDAILSNNDLYVMQKEVVTRQYILADIQRENQQKKAAEIIASEGCTFVPKINKISQFLIEADPQRVNESEAERLERLSKKDAQKKEIFQEQMQKLHYEQYSFKPEINQISKDIGKKTTVDDLAYNRDAKEHLRILREKSIDNMLTMCSFQPQVNKKKKYENVEPLYSKEESIMDNVKLVNKKKEIKYDQQRKMEEYNEMKECTFKPKIKGEVGEEILKPKLQARVAGLDKFMQMRDRHKKLIQEKKEREEEVFGIEKKYSAVKHEGFTTPQPFKLSQGNKKSIRDSKVAQELKEKMAKDYTFKPQTNEGKNREIINNYMSHGNHNGHGSQGGYSTQGGYGRRDDYYDYE